jgi:hypothetical protein
VIDNCRQATITGAVFAHLQGIQALGMYECRADQVATARSLGLRVNTRGCASYGSLLYTFDEPGEWAMACFEPGHYEGGMKGTVEVEPKL